MSKDESKDEYLITDVPLKALTVFVGDTQLLGGSCKTAVGAHMVKYFIVFKVHIHP